MSLQKVIKQYNLSQYKILNHGFVDNTCDYRVTVKSWRSEQMLSFLFKECVEVQYTLRSSSLNKSNGGMSRDYERWEDEGGWINQAVYPNWYYAENSSLASEWSKKFDQPVHQMFIEHDYYILSLVFKELVVQTK